MTEAAEAEETKTYEFDETFQRKIVALTVRDPVFVQKTAGLIAPEYFTSEVDSAIVAVLQAHYNTYKSVPAAGTLKTVFKDAIDTKRFRKDLVPDLIDRLQKIIKADLSDRGYVVDKVADFARHQAMENAILQSVHLLERRDFAKIDKIMKAAQQVGVNEDIGEYNYWAEIDNRTDHRVALAAGTIKPDGVSTGYADLDKYLYHQGWGRGELAVIMGAAKAGKSMSLGEFAKNASLIGHNVLYVTLEVSRRIIADRIDANLADTAIRALKDTPHAVNAKIKAANAGAGEFMMNEFPSGTLKASALRRLIERYRARGLKFDLIAVDYADIMCPERFTDNLQENSKSIYLELRAISQEEHAAMLTATQTNREGAKAMTSKATDVSEDFNKVRIADELLSINATDPEKASGEARLHFAASRNGESGFSLRIKQDRSRMQFLKKILGRE